MTFAYLARILKPTGFGVVEFCFAHALILSLMVDFGVGALGAREIAQRPGEIRHITQRMVGIRFWSMAVSVLLLGCYATFSPQPWPVKSLLLLLGASLLPMPWLFQWIFLGRQWMRPVSVSQIIRYGTFAGIVLLTVREASDMRNVAAAELAGVLAAAVFTVVYFRLKIGFWPPILPVPPGWSAIRQAVPIALSHFMWAAKYVFVTVLVGFLAGLDENAEQVGHFGAAIRIILTMSVFISLYVNNLLPSVSRAVVESMEWLQILLDRAVRASVWFAFCGSTLVFIGAPYMVRMVYGGAYEQAVILLQILVWMLAAALVSAHFRVTLIAAARQDLELVSTAAGAAVTLTLAITLYHRYGLTSVAIAMVFGELVTLVASLVFVHRSILPMRSIRWLWAPAAATIAAAMLLLAISSTPVWVRAATVVLIFFLAGALLDPAFMDVFGRTTASSSRAR